MWTWMLPLPVWMLRLGCGVKGGSGGDEKEAWKDSNSRHQNRKRKVEYVDGNVPVGVSTGRRSYVRACKTCADAAHPRRSHPHHTTILPILPHTTTWYLHGTCLPHANSAIQ